MLKAFRRWRENRQLDRLEWPDPAWENAIADWPVAQRYQGPQRKALRDLSRRFLLRKSIVPGGSMTLTEAMRLRIATMAAVPVLGLNLDWYQNWYTVIVYPEAFTPPFEAMDQYGVVHDKQHRLAGEAWHQGPVIVSWDDIERAGQGGGYNVVIHELAHKLDMRHDGPNGAPPFHKAMDPAAWKRDFTAAWDELEAAAQHHGRHSHQLPLDPYALENPGEFFAVVSEAFFEGPQKLQSHWPALYDHLCAFYRQNPLAD